MNEILSRLGDFGVIPVVAIERAEDALPLSEALLESSLPCVEVTFRTAAALDAIRNIVREYADMLVGAGTVLSVEQAQ